MEVKRTSSTNLGRHSRILFTSVVILLTLSTNHTYAQQSTVEFREFVSQWCLDCHSQPRPKADLDLDGALLALDEGDVWPVWRDVQERLIARDMPPRGELPEAIEYQQALAVLEPIVANLPTVTDGRHRTTLRRLNRAEYANTIADLFSVNFDPSHLPVDEIGHGFDNNGDMLSMSPLLFEKYMEAAEMIAQAAFVDTDRADPVTYELQGKDLIAQGGARQGRDAWVMYSNSVISGDVSIVHPGRYRLEAEVAGKQAGKETVKMALVLDASRQKTFKVAGNVVRQKIDVYVQLEPGICTPGVAFLNDYYNPEHPEPLQRDRNAYLASITLHGPLDVLDPTPLQEWLVDQTQGLDGPDRFNEQVRLLASLAWRRPVNVDELDPLFQAVDEAAGEDQREVHRLRIALTALLVHPRFLFRIEADPPPGQLERELDAWEWATRVSYFLWSSAPDEILREAAASGQLDNEGGRSEQLKRMIDDPRSYALADRFGAQWLQIDGLNRMRPDPEQFGDFTDDLLAAMRAETVLLFEAILREDRPVSELLNADWTFMNETLSDHYNIPGVQGHHMRRVSLNRSPEERPDQMGIFGHASVLLATSNPTRTSPVKRGKWVLEVLLDDPTPPPPANVDGLPDDGKVTGDMSLRAMLEVHRTDPACASCHERLDALGFALEPFDAVGRWRTSDSGLVIDASAQLPDGTTLNGPQGLRDLLLERPDFVRSCCRHLLTYALGRGLSEDDQAQVDEIVNRLGTNPTLRRMVIAVIESDAFRIRQADRVDAVKTSSNLEQEETRR